MRKIPLTHISVIKPVVTHCLLLALLFTGCSDQEVQLSYKSFVKQRLVDLSSIRSEKRIRNAYELIRRIYTAEYNQYNL